MGTVFTHTASLGILAPVFGDTYHRAQAANSKEDFIKSKEAASAATAWGSSLVGSAVQTYGVAALINATGTLSYKGAAYLGSLIFFASSAPSVCLSLHHVLRFDKQADQSPFLLSEVCQPGIYREETSRHCCCRCCRKSI